MGKTKVGDLFVEVPDEMITNLASLGLLSQVKIFGVPECDQIACYVLTAAGDKTIVGDPIIFLQQFSTPKP